jgi:hypothetical protein
VSPKPDRIRLHARVVGVRAQQLSNV